MAQIAHSPAAVPVDDEPATPMATEGQWVNDNHALLRTSSPELLTPTAPSGPGAQKWKGKGRAELEREAEEEEETQMESLVPAQSYPPASEEVVAEQRVNEVCYVPSIPCNGQREQPRA